MTCRKGKLAGKTVGYIALTGRTVTDNCLLVADQPALRRQELTQAFIWNVRNCCYDVLTCLT
ncbi:MAG TPA: hypothetical protein VFW07_27235, partial [Parafilimonas sp.]|nr:hypothetical protein [Parafilimonas sp.]